MKIEVKFRKAEDRTKLSFLDSDNLENLFIDCPSFIKLFPELIGRDDSPGRYLIQHRNPYLRKAISEIDRLPHRIFGERSLSVNEFNYLESFRKLFHNSMSKKKDIEVWYYK